MPFEPLPLGRLAGIYWGHDHGKLLEFKEQYHYFWEDETAEVVFNDEALRLAPENPFSVPEMPGLLLKRVEHPKRRLPKTQSYCCFSKVPWEILEMPALDLTTGSSLCFSGFPTSHT